MGNGAFGNVAGKGEPETCGSVEKGVALASTWVAVAAALLKPSAPGNSPYRLSKLWFSR